MSQHAEKDRASNPNYQTTIGTLICVKAALECRRRSQQPKTSKPINQLADNNCANKCPDTV